MWPSPQQLDSVEFDTLINGSIKHFMQAFSKLTGPASDSSHLLAAQYLPLVSVMYYQLDANNIPRGVVEEDYPLKDLDLQFGCLEALGSALAVLLDHADIYPGLIKELKGHWPDIRQWILYLHQNIIVNEEINFAVRLKCKSAVIHFLGLVRDGLLKSWSTLIPGDRAIMRVLCSLWALEARDPSFSSWSEGMRDQRESPVFNSVFVLAHEVGIAIDWGNLLNIFRNDPESMSSASFCHLNHELSQAVLDLHSVACDLHIISMFSSREDIRLALLRQGTIKATVDVLTIIVSRTWKKEERVVACRCMINAITLLGIRLEALDAIPYILQAVDCDLIPSLLRSDLLLRFVEDPVAVYQPVRLLGDIITRYTVYRSVLRALAFSIDSAEENKLDLLLVKGGRLHGAWSSLKDAVDQRRKLDLGERHIQTCQNDKCSRAGEVGAFKRCAGCLHSYYCSKKCQREDWRSGRHKAYCNMVNQRFTRTNGAMSSIHSKDRKFLDGIILAELRKHQSRISDHQFRVNVVELNFVGAAVGIMFDSQRVNPDPFGVECVCEHLSRLRWEKMLDGMKDAEKPLVLVRAFIPGGMARKVVLQGIPLSRILDGENQDHDRRCRKQMLEPYVFNLVFSCCGKDSVNQGPHGAKT